MTRIGFRRRGSRHADGAVFQGRVVQLLGALNISLFVDGWPGGICERIELHLACAISMGRSQLKLKASGGEVLWFECACNFRWSGSTPAAKSLAWKLHAKKCEMVKGVHVEPVPRNGPAVVRCQESTATAAQRIIERAREERGPR